MNTTLRKAGITLATLGLAATGALMSSAPAQAAPGDAPGPNQYRDYGPIGGTSWENYLAAYQQCWNEYEALEWDEKTPLYQSFERCEYHNENGFVFYRLSWSDSRNVSWSDDPNL